MNKTSKKILVTGAAGFLGSHLAIQLSKMNHNVICVDNMIGGYKDNVPSGIEFFDFDCYDLKKMNNTLVKKNTNVFGSRTAMELKGISCVSFEPHQEKRKNCCVSRSFGEKVTTLEELNEAITTHCLNAAEKIRLDQQTVKKLTVFIRTSPFQKGKNYYANSRDINLPIRTNDSIELVRCALIALKYIYKKGYKYQKAGIIFSELSDVDAYKKNLFSSINNEEKRKNLMKAIDYTNIKYGRHALSIAQAGLKKKWNIKRQHSSKIDTSCFDFLPVIRVA